MATNINYVVSQAMFILLILGLHGCSSGHEVAPSTCESPRLDERSLCVHEWGRCAPPSAAPVRIQREGTLCFPPSQSTTYGNDLSCGWRITAPPQLTVHLKVTSMSIERCTNCACDDLEVFQGPDCTGTPIWKLCGGSQWPTIYSVGQDLFIRFRSDHSIVDKGFKVQVTFIKKTNTAFHVSMNSSVEAQHRSVKLNFPSISVNEGGAFQPASSQFITPNTGYYFFSLSAGASAGKPVEMVLYKNGVPYISVIRTCTSHSGQDMLSRSAILPLDVGDVVEVWVHSNTAVYSDEGLQTSFTGFILPDSHPRAAMFAAVPYNVSTHPEWYVSGFQKRLTDAGNWGDYEDRFLAPFSGIYYAEFSIGTEGQDRRDLRHNYRIVAADWLGYYALGSGITTSSKGTGLVMEENDLLHMTTYLGKAKLFSNQELQTSMLAFLISEPPYEKPFVCAWHDSMHTIPQKMEFSRIEIDTLNAFSTSGTFTCPKKGIYFVNIGLGVAAHQKLHVKVMKNDEKVTALTRFITDQGVKASLSKTLLIDLDEGDEVWLDLVEGLSSSVKQAPSLDWFSVGTRS